MYVYGCTKESNGSGGLYNQQPCVLKIENDMFGRLQVEENRESHKAWTRAGVTFGKHFFAWGPGNSHTLYF